MNRTVLRCLFFVSASFWLGACQRSSSGPVVARVGSERIYVEDFQARLREAPPAYQQYVASADGRKEFLNLMVREKVLLAEAKRLGIPHDPAYQKAVAKFKTDWNRRLREYEETLQVESALRRLRTTDLAASDAEVDQY